VKDRTFLKTAAAMSFAVVVMLLVILTGEGRPQAQALPVLETILVFPDSVCVCPPPTNPYHAERDRMACYYDSGEDLSWQMENLRRGWR